MEYIYASGLQNYLTAKSNYSSLAGKANLYKCFVHLSWTINNIFGCAGFLHPEGVYDDPLGGRLRENVYKRLIYHFQFQNELCLFHEVDHHVKFSINIYGAEKIKIEFHQISNLFIPHTIDQCFNSSVFHGIEGIKDNEGKWNIKGHSERLICVNEETLKIFAKIYETRNSDYHSARLMAVHCNEVLSVLEKLSKNETRICDLGDKVCSTIMFDETASLKEKIIKQEVDFHKSLETNVLSGPHIYVSNPAYKTSRRESTKNSDYDVVDLTSIPEDYFPRVKYVPLQVDTFRKKIPKVSWGRNEDIVNYFRIFARFMLSQSGERTLISAILPPGVSHVMSCYSFAFSDYVMMVMQEGCFSSIPFDFFVKATANPAIAGVVNNLLILPPNNEVMLRTLLLNCITKYYSKLWELCWMDVYAKDNWVKSDVRLSKDFKNLRSKWMKEFPLISDYERRQALIEIDVLIASALGITLKELCSIYRIQFPVLRKNENDTWYDQKGRIVFTCSKGLPGVGFSRPEWDEIKGMKAGMVERKITDDTLPGGPRERTIVYHAPFDRCDREKDYEVAWKEFEKRFKDKKEVK
jgi:hypothetical protein